MYMNDGDFGGCLAICAGVLLAAGFGTAKAVEWLWPIAKGWLHAVTA